MFGSTSPPTSGYNTVQPHSSVRRRTSTKESMESASTNVDSLAGEQFSHLHGEQSHQPGVRLLRLLADPAGTEPKRQENLEQISAVTDGYNSTKQPKNRDWLKIAGLVIAIAAGIFLVFAGLCAAGVFPPEFLGGGYGLGISFTVAGILFTAGASALIYRWYVPHQKV